MRQAVQGGLKTTGAVMGRLRDMSAQGTLAAIHIHDIPVQGKVQNFIVDLSKKMAANFSGSSCCVLPACQCHVTPPHLRELTLTLKPLCTDYHVVDTRDTCIVINLVLIICT